MSFQREELSINALRKIQNSLRDTLNKESISPSEKEETSRLLNNVYALAEEIFLRYLKFSEANQENSKKRSFIILLGGSVAAGKSTLANGIKEIFLRMEPSLKTEVFSSDAFIRPTKWLKENNLLEQKGFPVSYEIDAMTNFIANIRNNNLKNAVIPVYSHSTYDRVPGLLKTVPENTDIVILEGVNVLVGLQEYPKHESLKATYELSDLNIYLDFPEEYAELAHRNRFLGIIHNAKDDKTNYFYEMAKLNEQDLLKIIKKTWMTINHVNLEKYIAPSAKNADLIVQRNQDFKIKKLISQN